MQVLTQSGDRMYLQNTDTFGSIALRTGYIGFPGAGEYIAQNEDQSVLEERFLDIVAAIDSGDVRVYDTRKAVGYWKPKPARAAKKPAAAKKAPATPPPAEPKK